MKLTIDTFEEGVDYETLKRGKKYYYDLCYRLLYKIGNELFYLVEGSREYLTSINVENDVIISSSCSCPYDQEDVCKHIIAVLYDYRTIQDILCDLDIPDLHELIDELTDEERRNISNDNLEDLTFIKTFILKKTTENTRRLKHFIVESFKYHLEIKKDGSFDTYNFSSEMADILKNMSNNCSSGEMILIIRYMYHEIGRISREEYGEYNAFIPYLHELNSFDELCFYEYISSKNMDKIEKIVDLLVTDFQDFIRYDELNLFPLDILTLLDKLSYCEYAKNKVDQLIEEVTNSVIQQENHSEVEPLFKIEKRDKNIYTKNNKYQMLVELDRFYYKRAVRQRNKNIVDEVINRNFMVDFEFFKLKIGSYFKEKNFNEAKHLLFKEFNSNYHIEQLEGERFFVVQQTSDLLKKKELFKERLLSKITYKYYVDYKSIASKEELINLVDYIIDKHFNNKRIMYQVVHMLIDLKRFDDVMVVVRKHKKILFNYYNLIPNKYNKEKFELCERYIYEQVNNSKTRDEYQSIAYNIFYLELHSSKSTKHIIKKLKNKYPKKRALHEEIDGFSDDSDNWLPF
jgi:hypothetical protein